MSFFRVNERCNGCLSCVQNCPASALSHSDQGNKRKLFHNMSLCARCGNCWRVCPQQAVEFEALLRGKWDEVATMDLVRCVVCGEPLYTHDLKNTLATKLDYHVDALCPQHRQSNFLTVWRRLSAGGADKKRTNNDYREA